MHLDTAVIEPSSISIRPVVPFDYDPVTQTISFQSELGDSIFVCYRILPTNLLPTLYNRDISTYDVSFFEPSSKRKKGYPSETHVKRGIRIVRGNKELVEKLGRNDLCPCGSGRRF